MGCAGTFLLLLVILGLVFAWSIVAGIAALAFLVGGFLLTNRVLVCGNCGNRLDGAHVSVCPTCGATLS